MSGAEPVTGEDWAKLSPAQQAVTPILACEGCGAVKHEMTGSITDLLPAKKCGACPPWICDGCGEQDSMVQHCPCWVDLTAMPLADQKALFARDGMFNLGADGRLTPGHDHG